jgi:hypothetical protein
VLALILDSPEHVESENIKFKIGHRSSAYQLFSKRDLNSSFLERFYSKYEIFQKNRKIPFLPIFATFYKLKITFFKKLVDGAPVIFFQFDVF